MHLYQALPVRRLEQFRDLSIVWFQGKPPSQDSVAHRRWVEFWQTMTLFASLEKLTVEIRLPPAWKTLWAREEARLLRDVGVVIRPASFNLVLGWPAGTGVPELPCRVLRMMLNCKPENGMLYLPD